MATSALAADAYKPDPNATRASIPKDYQWDLTPLFASDAAWESSRAKTESDFATLEAYKGKLKDGKALKSALETYFRVHDAANNVTLYANLRLTTDQSDAAAQGMNEKAQALMNALMDKASFLRSEILAMDDKTLEAAFKKEKGLEVYRGYVENLRRRKPHLLTDEAEKVLSLAGDNLWAEIDLNELISPAQRTFNQLLSNIPWPAVHNDKGESVQLTLSSYPRYRTSPNRAVRQEAVTKFLGTLHQYRDTFASTLSAQDALDVTYAKARHYDTAQQAYLDKDQIDPAVYKNLIDAVHANLTPLHRYVALRKKALNLPEVHLYDLYVPMVPGVEVPVTYDEARNQITQALAPLGDDYVKILSEGMDPKKGWIDVYPSVSKESGAFSANVYGKHPYVMMNFQDSADDMSTLAHEYGHALHSYLSSEKQPYQSFRYVPFLAEVASTANETLLLDWRLAHTTDPAQKAYLLNERLETIRGTIYRQTLFAEFDWKVHTFLEEGTPVTADLLEKTYGDLVRQYYGPEYAMDPNDVDEWAYIPHFYYKYYVFVYATGLSSGIAIAEKIKAEGAPARDAYLKMLRSGSSAPPLELLKGAGVDLTRPDAVTAALKVFDQTVTELDALLPQIQPPPVAPPVVPPAKPKKK